MSQFRTEVLPFPWTPIIVTLLGIGFIYLIGKWVYEFGLWIWFNRPAEKRRSRDDSDDEREEDSPKEKRKSSSKKRSSGRKRRNSDAGSGSDNE